MSNYYHELEKTNEPNREELKYFITETQKLLSEILSSEGCTHKLFSHNDKVLVLAKATFGNDVKPAVNEFVEDIDRIDEKHLKIHGLIGGAANFKYKALVMNVKKWRRWNGQLTIGKGFRAVFEAIDVILDSLIDSIGTGLGGLIKEFKDMLMSCAVFNCFK